MGLSKAAMVGSAPGLPSVGGGAFCSQFTLKASWVPVTPLELPPPPQPAIEATSRLAATDAARKRPAWEKIGIRIREVVLTMAYPRSPRGGQVETGAKLYEL